MAEIEVTFPSGGQPGKILKWRVSSGTMVSAGRVLLLYQSPTSVDGDAKGLEMKLRVTRFGRVIKLLAKEGDIVHPGQVLLTLEGCKHPTVMKDLCAECGVDLRVEGIDKDGNNATLSQASVPMVHSVPELKVCPELAKKIGKEDEERLLKDRKLALLVDLDQTIVHTTNDNISPNMKDVYHFQLYGPRSPWYHTRLRPHTRHFLSEMSRLYELHICTFGARNYAHTIASLLDKDGVLFSHRILSRDECFDPASKTANLKALFPCGDDMVCIIDDREDVWQGCGNLVQVKPYHFFRHTGDIHAPPGLEKFDAPGMPELENVRNPNVEDVEDSNKNGVPDDCNKQKESSNSQEGGENVSKLDEIKSKNNNPESGKGDEAKLQSGDNKNNETSEKLGIVPETNTELNKEKHLVEAPEGKVSKNAESVVDEDDDDYLLYLEDILRRIHTEFYNNIEKDIKRRSLREIIPRVRSQVLKGVHLTFSGLIPTNQKLHESKAYKVARAFGAEVTQDITDETTHLVAIKPGTAKANTAKKNPNIKIVNPDWLWTCAERWEHVDERLFPLTAKARGSRVPPPHCSSPDHIEGIGTKETKDSFADSINPLMSFTPEEIEIMDKEVDEDMEDPDADLATFDIEDLDNLDEDNKRARSSSSESAGSLNEDEPYESVRKKMKARNESSEDENSLREGDEDDKEDGDNDEDDDDDDDPVTRFRRGEDLPDDIDLGDNSQDSVEDLMPDDTEDDREWNAMGAALEREFLSE